MQVKGRIAIRGATVVTMDPVRSVLPDADVLVADGQIERIAQATTQAIEGYEVVDARGQVLIPGLVQTHVHLCQTLFRGLADDLELLDWLKERIWPLEGAHDPQSLHCSALLGIAELLRGGTTTILDMETVHHTEAALEAISESGIRAIAGKCMMDHGASVPASLLEETGASVRESVDLLQTWNLRENGRIRYALSPRFVVSCSDALLREVQRISEHYGVCVHTHAAENQDEVALVKAERGRLNVEHLAQLGLVGPRLVMAHAIWVEPGELDLIAAGDSALAHCPSSNLKLGSGIAATPQWLRRGIRFGIGADGAPCNNHLDMWAEMRLCALVQKPFHGARAMAAPQVFALATIDGARALGLGAEVGSIEVGKRADLVLLDWSGPHHMPLGYTDVYSHLVYESKSSDVVMTIIDGRVLFSDGVIRSFDEAAVSRRSETDLKRLVERSGIAVAPTRFALNARLRRRRGEG